MDGGSTPPKSTILCLTNRQFEMEQKKKRNYGKMTAAVNLVKSGVFGVKDIRSAFKDPMYSEFATTLVQQGVLVQARKYSQKKKAIQQGTWVVPVDKAIKLLTENGYRVPKPILIYEEVTVK